ncbi:MAG: hypothetical protein Fur0022_08750 [Anaerolineales bacterium]
MTLQIDNPGKVPLTYAIEQALTNLFREYKGLVIFREFTGGFSGSRVYEIQPVPNNGIPELPAIVKIAANSLAEREWQAYQTYIRNRLYNAATITSEPVFNHGGWGALRYTLTGGGAFEVLTMREFLCRAETSLEEIRRIFDYLLRNMHNFWRFNTPEQNFSFSDSYDHLLPVHLLIQYQKFDSTENVEEIHPHHIPVQLPVKGSKVRAVDFAVHKVDPTTKTVTLQIPEIKGEERASFLLRCRYSDEDFPLLSRLNDLITISGKVVETRIDRLQTEVHHLLETGLTLSGPYIQVPGPEPLLLYDPLQGLDRVLAQTMFVNKGPIHGDFNLGNLLIEPENTQLTLIDFADARIDHTLHDILRLETEVITWMLPTLMSKDQEPSIHLMANLFLHLQFLQPQTATISPETLLPVLHKPWLILNALHKFARHYFYDANDPREFYSGLFLYLLGALKYKNLSRKAKQLAFWGACLCYHNLFSSPEDYQALLKTINTQTHFFFQEEISSNPHLLNQIKILAHLPLEHIPHLATLPAVSRMLLSRNSAFVGRIQELKHIAKVVKGGGTIAVTGLGGIGKSQLISEFVYRYGQFFSGGVFWLSFALPEMVSSEFVACGGREHLNLTPHFGELPLEDQLALVAAAWEQPTPRLLIFDNCESVELFEKWQPKSGGSRVIVTSRRASWNETSDLETLPLNVLERPSSMNLLRAYYPVAGDAILDAIAHDLGDLPLALDLAGRYLARYQTSVKPAQYLAQLREPRLQKELLEHRIGVSPTAHVRNVNRTFAISYEMLNPDDPIDAMAVNYLKTAACLAPGEPIPLKLLKLNQPPAPPLSPSGLPFDAETKAINRLVELGLIRKEENQTYRLHRLIAVFVYNQEPDIGIFRQLVEIKLTAETEQINQKGRPIELQTWLSHLRYVTNNALQLENTMGIQLGTALAEYLYQAGDYTGAQAYYEQNISLCKKLVGHQNPLTAKNLADLGNIYLQLGDLERAWDSLEQALAIQLEVQGELHADTAITLNNMGFLLQSQGSLSEASNYHQRAFATRQFLFGSNHPDIAESLVNLAYIAFRDQKWSETKDNLLQALAIYRQHLGEDHHRTISVLEYLGEVARAEKDWRKAEDFFSQVLADRLRVLGENHRATARVLEFLGEACAYQGNLVSAKSYYKRTLNIRLLVLGANHPSTLDAKKKFEALNVGDGVSN